MPAPSVPSEPSPSENGATQSAVVGEIEVFLQDAIRQMPPDPAEMRRRGPGRPRILPALCLWAGMIVCVLQGFTSQLALWRLLTERNFWFYPRFAVTDQAVYKRLEAAGTEPLENLFAQISTLLATRLAPYVTTILAPFASEVVALDHTKLDQIARSLPALRDVPPGDVRLLPGQLAGLFDVRRQQWRTVRYIANPLQNEKLTAGELVGTLPAGSLVVMDLGFFAFHLFDEFTDAHYWWISRLRSKTSYKVCHVFYAQGETFDGIVWLGGHRADRAKHAVRLVCFRVGKNLHRYITNVLDPEQLSMRGIAQVYARRWDFELAVNLIKRHLDLHLLWSAKDVVIQQQVWAVLIIAQIFQAVRFEIAGRAGVDPFEVSMALLVEYLPRFAYRGEDPIARFIAHARELRFIRPSTRTNITAPTIPLDQLLPLPPDLALERTPRYAKRKCGPRSTEAK